MSALIRLVRDFIAWRGTLSWVREPMCGVITQFGAESCWWSAGGLDVEHIGPVAADLATVESGYDVGSFYDYAAGAVEDDHAVLHFRDGFSADHAAGFF